MYSNLRKALEEKSISIKNYAKILEVTEKTAQNKINGKTEFTLSEVNKTIELFPEYTLRYLFEDGFHEKASV